MKKEKTTDDYDNDSNKMNMILKFFFSQKLIR